MKPIAEIRNAQDRFVAFIVERENCRHSKEMGLVPHTDDPILAVNKFCNVNREHDAVTRWVKEHVRDREDLSHEDMISHLLVARIFNNPAALQFVIPFAKLDAVAKRLNALRAEGKSVFRGAYMMVVHGDAGRGKNAIDFYCNLVKEVRLLTGGNLPIHLCDVANRINSVTGLGVFMANQIVTDLRYTRFYPKAETPDWTTFVWPGPGTIRGVRRFYGADVAAGRNPGHDPAMINVKNVPNLLMKIRHEMQSRLPAGILNHFEDPNNLSNCFCEFDKYERVLGLVPSGTDRKATLRKYQAQ